MSSGQMFTIKRIRSCVQISTCSKSSLWKSWWLKAFVDEAEATNKAVDVTNHMCQEIRTSCGIVSLALTPEFWKVGSMRILVVVLKNHVFFDNRNHGNCARCPSILSSSTYTDGKSWVCRWQERRSHLDTLSKPSCNKTQSNDLTHCIVTDGICRERRGWENETEKFWPTSSHWWKYKSV